MTYKEAIKVLRFVLDPREYPNGEKSKCYQYNLGAINKAIEALEKQTPKKPTRTKGKYGHTECACCGWVVESFCGDLEQYPFCPNCGQAIDWSDEE